ncbi:MAG: hypothetical protein AB8U31_01580 [Anaplasma ovis]
MRVSDSTANSITSVSCTTARYAISNILCSVAALRFSHGRIR